MSFQAFEIVSRERHITHTREMERLFEIAEKQGKVEMEMLKEAELVQVLKVLPPYILRQLDSDPSVPYTSEEEYLEVPRSIAWLRGNLMAYDTTVTDAFISSTREGRPDVVYTRGMIILLRGIIEKLSQIKKSKLAVTEPSKRPRMVRVFEKLELTEKEEGAMELALFQRYSNIVSMGPSLGMSIIEMIKASDPQRNYVKQNFFDYYDSNKPLYNSWSMSANITNALMGLPISQEDLLRLDGTAVHEVLQEEMGLTESTDALVNPNYNEPENDEDNVDVSPEEDSEELDLSQFIKSQIELEKNMAPSTEETNTNDIEESEDDTIPLTPYTEDLDYLQTESKRIHAILQVAEIDRSIKSNRSANYDDQQQNMRQRQLKAKSKEITRACAKRLKSTREAGPWLPRLERMIQIRGFDQYERDILITLIASNFSTHLENMGYSSGMSVSNLITSFTSDLEQQIHRRKYFYKGARLVKEGIICMTGGTALDDDLMSAYVTIDRRMIEFILGIDSEFSELVEGSHLYLPKVKLEQVVLSAEVKKLILSTVENFDSFKRARKRMGFEETLTYGSGIVMLFFGASGTGKTMVANAIANHMNKRLLLINFPSLGKMSAGESLKFIFREAKINDAILFFDECEGIFESREFGSSDVNTLLTEIERHDGLVIMATNRAYDLDEAMHRRITLAIEFIKPDPILRESIWRNNIPSGMKLADDVILSDLAMNFELTGGLIKNAILSALSIAVSRDGEKEATVRQEDFEAGARLQLRGRLRMIDFEHRVVPTQGLESLVLSKAKLEQLQSVVEYEKARQILYGQWGFDKIMGQDKANSVLFWGPPGTGKTLAAEAVAFSTGKPLKFVNTGELVSKWVGDTGKNINSIFEEAQANDAVLFFDEADAIFGRRTAVTGSTDKEANQDTGLLLYHMEHYKGIVILSSNLISEIDPAFFRRIKFVIEFVIPGAKERVTLWRKLIPSECPVEEELNLEALARRHEFTGGQIKMAIIRAASKASLREENQRITSSDLEEAALEEERKQGQTSHTSLYA
ncbi:hypothetical protein PROFUN_07406 [Planoprotostelium fungivorum]|uniref:AAA+ ATPase domain-containing protein n=1 Tax=Planoprotostelium fungivorum TaxID=1890364 RepID=A0A2P6MTI3_9EUKA|nr:hypothetical protein PROFUN_07406 [Planoprotostelium fungivorum]